MSCPNANSPIDISLENISGKCDLKCSYSFKYPNSSCIATNRGDYLSITYDTFSNPPVKYNAVDYNVQEIRIYCPSLHSFNGKKTDAEFIIIHNSNRGTSPLLVCIPLINDNTESSSSKILTQILNSAALNANVDGESTTIDINDFSLNSFVPMKPFYSYTALQPYQPCVGDVNIIVYTPKVAKSYISNDSLSKLNSVIQQNAYTIKTGPLLFLNDKGPGANITTDDIYIDCQPINKSNEEIKISSASSTSTSNSSDFSINWDTIKNNPIFQIIMGSLLFIFILLIFNMIIKLIAGGPSKIESIYKSKTKS